MTLPGRREVKLNQVRVEGLGFRVSTPGGECARACVGGFYLKERPPTLMRALRARPGQPHYSLLGFRVPNGNSYVVFCFYSPPIAQQDVTAK